MNRVPCRCAIETYAKGLCKNCYQNKRNRIRREGQPRKHRAPGPPTCHPDRPHEARGLCGSCYQKWQRTRDPERARRRNKQWRESNPAKFRAAIRKWNLKKCFGITVEEYDVMLSAQGGRCVLCDRHERDLSKRLAIDHDHETGAVRALLCGPCNVVLGYIENGEWFSKAIAYLAGHNKRRRRVA